jgi:hypothetical protein
VTEKKTTHDPIGTSIPPFSSEDTYILDHQLMYLDWIDDEGNFESEVSRIDSSIALLSESKRKLFEDRRTSPERRVYLEQRKVFILKQIELRRIQQAVVAEQRRKENAKLSRRSSRTRTRTRKLSPTDQETLRLLQANGVSRELLENLGLVESPTKK